jgi:hypothetical protein
MPRPAHPLLLRYVVLRHDAVSSPHYDLLFETAPGSPLASVRCLAWPPAPDAPLERIADHRRIYLDYEGPVSGDRGHVTRVASGSCAVTPTEDGSLAVTFDTGLNLRVPRR